MATYTENYDLKKPAGSDYYNIADANGNMDIIDEALSDQADDISDLEDRAYSVESDVEDLTDEVDRIDGEIDDLSVVKLLSGTTTSAKTTLVIDVSQIDLNPYSKMEIVLSLPGDGNGATLSVTAEGANSTSMGSMLSSYPTGLDLHLLFIGSRIAGYGLFVGKSSMSMTGVVFSNVQRSNLMSIEFKAALSGTTKTIPSGTKYSVYGVKE